MTKTVIPLESFPRAEHFRYFLSMKNPFFSITQEIDITKFQAMRKKYGDPFFLTFNYCVCRAANELAPFRQRIQAGQLVEYDCCFGSHTLLLPDGRYVYAESNATLPFEDYLQKALAAQEKARQNQTLTDESDPLSLLFITCLPWMSYTALTFPTADKEDSNPRFAWGKPVTRDGRSLMPFTLQAHHGLVDGFHVAKLIQGIEANLRSYVQNRLGTLDL